MTRTVRYLTHPQVQIDPAKPVPDWSLNATGAARVAALAADPGALGATRRIVSSAEVKALETARPLALALGLSVEIRPDMHENDRSATGFLPRRNSRRWRISSLPIPRKASGGGKRQRGRRRGFCAKWIAAYRRTGKGMCCLSGMAASARCCFARFLACRSAAFTIRGRAVGAAGSPLIWRTASRITAGRRWNC